MSSHDSESVFATLDLLIRYWFSTVLCLLYRLMATILSKSIVYKSFGDPRKVLELISVPVPSSPPEGKVLVQWLASPVNPLDINRVQGLYAVRAELPCIAGSEGIGRVIKVGRGSQYSPGDHVTIFSTETPFWTEYGLINEEELYKLDKRIDLDLGATFMVNPPTAWVMLRHFVNLTEGDYIIQNAANSGVGRSVIELCRVWKIKTINIVRTRDNIEKLKTELWKLGANHVFTEEEFITEGKKFIRSLPSAPRLALNGVGGRSSLIISSTLERGATCVVYGGMSKKPHEFSTSNLVFNDLQVRGVAIGLWMREGENQEAFRTCMKELQSLAIAGHLSAPPMDRVHMDSFQLAIERSMDGKHGKQLIIMSSPEAKL